MRIGILGPLEITVDGTMIRPGGIKPRSVLAMLALDVGRVLSTDRLVEGVWGEDPPAGATATLQVHVSNLRKAIPGSIVTRAPGYLLDLEPDAVDVHRFLATVDEARAAIDRADPASAHRLLVGALGEWRGDPLSDLVSEPFAASAVPWLTELRLDAIEARFAAALEVRPAGSLVPDLEAAVAEHPLRERLWGHLMTALYRAGRQADALAAFRRAREQLVDELGIDPSAELRAIEDAILRQDPSLDAPTQAVTVAEALSLDEPATIRATARHDIRLVFSDGREMRLGEGPVVLGRGLASELVVDDLSVSRRHAEFRPSLGTHLLLDQGSTNGTFVNGELVVQALLTDGDELAFGDVTATYRCE